MKAKADTPVYSQGISGGGAAILKDGVMMTIEEIITELNEKAALQDALDASVARKSIIGPL